MNTEALNARPFRKAMLFLLLMLSAHFAEAADDSLTEIKQSSVFYQALMWTGKSAPPPDENAFLAAEIRQGRTNGLDAITPDLERFVETHPDSGWTPSLEANLGRYDFEHGRYSDALEQWQQAWAATKDLTNGPGKVVGDFTLTYWSRLLARLGRKEVLGPLFQETEGRALDHGSLQTLFSGAKTGYRHMIMNPGDSFKCGTFALVNVGQGLNAPATNLEKINQVPSPTNGFSLDKLVQLSDQYGLNLVPIEWDANKTLVAPSVVHWKVDHYAAILKETNGHYWVNDPTFGRARWLRGDDIRAEASGQFLVPKNLVPPGSRLLTPNELTNIFGRGYVDGFYDEYDSCGNGSGGNSGGSGGGGGGGGGGLGRGRGPGGGGNGASGSTGGSGSSCSTNSCPSCGCAGMPVWEVSDPYISLWLHDTPMSYQPGEGSPIAFKLSYKQRDTSPTSSNFFGLGPHWECSWLSYFDGGPTMYLPGGGERDYTPDNSTPEFYSHSVLQQFSSGDFFLYGDIVTYPDNSKEYYTNLGIGPDGDQTAVITKKVDPYGFATTFVYQTNAGLLTLQQIIDADGRTTTISYDDTNLPNQITRVTDPFGNQVTLKYDDSSGLLTNVTDVVGMSSSFKYDSNGWATNLMTPYGSTSFTHYEATTNILDALRAIRVIDAVGGTNVWLLRELCNDFMPVNYAGPVPTNLPPATAINAGDDPYFQYGNSFHWAPRQAGNLPTDFDSIPTNAFVAAHMKHWLHSGINASFISQSVDMEQEASPDGINPGQVTWYDYDGEPNSYQEGTDSQPSLIAGVVPDGTTWFRWFQRDSLGRPTNVVETYSAGYGAPTTTRSNIFVYDANGVDLDRIIGALGETNAAYGYNANHQVVAFTNAVGDVTTYTYDAQGRLTSTHTPAGLVTTNLYFTSGVYTNWIEKTIDIQIGRTNMFAYTNDQIYIQTNELGLVTTNTWDALNRLTSTHYPDGTFTSNVYKRLDLAVAIDRLGFSNCFGYDAVRRRILATNELGNVTSNIYCPCGALEYTVDALNNTTGYSYDNAGRLTDVSYPDGYSVSYTLDLLGNPIVVSDSSGASTTNWFDNQGLRYSASNYFGQVAKTTFDVEDRAVTNVDANGVTVTNFLDNLGRVVIRGYPDGGVEKFFYQAGSLIAYTNQLTNVTLYAYDAAMRKTVETNANLEVTDFTYDSAGDVLTLTDGNSHTTTWTYDTYGRVSFKLDAAGDTNFIYGYDSDDRLTSRWTPAKGTTQYHYDKAGNLTNVVYPVSPALSFAYDADNRLTNMIDAAGTSVYSYDQVGQLLSEDGPWSNDTVSYTYGNRLRTRLNLQLSNSATWSQSYQYDYARRLTGTTSPAGPFSYGYDPVRRLEVGQVTYPFVDYVQNDYDTNGRMLSTTFYNPATNLDSHSYLYNVGNQRTQHTFLKGNYETYAYDKIGQLTNAVGKELGGGTNRLQEQFGYAYDAVHNLNGRTESALTNTFSVNNLNELSTGTHSGTLTVAGDTSEQATSVTVNGSAATLYNDFSFAASGFGVTNGINTFTAIGTGPAGSDTNSVTVTVPSTANYNYDANGNLTNDGLRIFAYDDENELTSIIVTNSATNSTLTSNIYDGKLRMRIRKEYTWSSGWVETNEIHFVYDGNLAIQERNSNNVPMVTYTRGLDLSGKLQGAGGIGGLLARTDNTQTNTSSQGAGHGYYFCDGNGNITLLVDYTQGILARYDYDPFGHVTEQSGPLCVSNVYQYSSKEYHAPSGLVYYLYRWYDPNLQRWLSRDPMEEEEGGPNLYAMLCNDPVDDVDALGLIDYKFEVIVGTSGFKPTSWFGAPGKWGQPAWAATGDYAILGASAYSSVTIRTRTNPRWGTGNSCNTVYGPGGQISSGTIKLYLRDACPGDFNVSIYYVMQATGTGPLGMGSSTLVDANNTLIDKTYGSTKSPDSADGFADFTMHVGTGWTLAATYEPIISIGPDKGVRSTATDYGMIRYMSAAPVK